MSHSKNITTWCDECGDNFVGVATLRDSRILAKENDWEFRQVYSYVSQDFARLDFCPKCCYEMSKHSWSGYLGSERNTRRSK